MNFIRDDAGFQVADVRDWGVGDGQDGAGALRQRGRQGAVHLLLDLCGASLLPLTVRVVFNGELQQPARLLDQKVNLRQKRARTELDQRQTAA